MSNEIQTQAVLAAVAAAVLPAVSDEALMAEIARRGLGLEEHSISTDASGADLVAFIELWSNAAGVMNLQDLQAWVSETASGYNCEEFLRYNDHTAQWINNCITSGEHTLSKGAREEIIREWLDEVRP